MRCGSCGTENRDEATACAGCGAALGDHRYAPPASSLDEDAAAAYGGEAWERKRWRISGLSWAAMWLSVFVPPLGLVLSFFAIGAANRFRRRPGNRAMAYAALGTALYMGFIWGVMAFTIWSEARRAAEAEALFSLGAPYGDPSPAASPDDTAELQRLLEQLSQQPVPAE